MLKKRIIIPVVLIVAVICSGIAGINWYNSPVQKNERMQKYILKGEYAKAKKLMDDPYDMGFAAHSTYIGVLQARDEFLQTYDPNDPYSSYSEAVKFIDEVYSFKYGATDWTVLLEGELLEQFEYYYKMTDDVESYVIHDVGHCVEDVQKVFMNDVLLNRKKSTFFNTLIDNLDTATEANEKLEVLLSQPSDEYTVSFSECEMSSFKVRQLLSTFQNAVDSE